MPRFSDDRSGVAAMTDALWWRWQFRLMPWLKRLAGIKDIQWSRVVMTRECEQYVRTLDPSRLDVLDVSAAPDNTWSRFGFQSYRTTMYPQYDVCEQPLALGVFDLVIADQVLEHVHHPLAAVRNIRQMLKPRGVFLVSTPFLLRVHGYPDDYHRWTPNGLRQLLVDAGFENDNVTAASWGNRACVRANFSRFPSWIPWWHSLKNEPLYPVVVWAFARRRE